MTTEALPTDRAVRRYGGFDPGLTAAAFTSRRPSSRWQVTPRGARANRLDVGRHEDLDSATMTGVMELPECHRLNAVFGPGP